MTGNPCASSQSVKRAKSSAMLAPRHRSPGRPEGRGVLGDERPQGEAGERSLPEGARTRTPMWSLGRLASPLGQGPCAGGAGARGCDRARHRCPDAVSCRYITSACVPATIVQSRSSPERIADATRRRRVPSGGPRHPGALRALDAGPERSHGSRSRIHRGPPGSLPSVAGTADSGRSSAGLGCDRDRVRRAARVPVGDRALAGSRTSSGVSGSCGSGEGSLDRLTDAERREVATLPTFSRHARPASLAASRAHGLIRDTTPLDIGAAAARLLRERPGAWSDSVPGSSPGRAARVRSFGRRRHGLVVCLGRRRPTARAGPRRRPDDSRCRSGTTRPRTARR